MIKEFDVVNRAKHYNLHPSGVEVACITDYLNFNLGNTFKYVVRRYYKNDGAEYIRGLKSAQWYQRRFHHDPAQDPFCPFYKSGEVLALLREYEDAETNVVCQRWYHDFVLYLCSRSQQHYKDCMDGIEALILEAPRIVTAEIRPIRAEDLNPNALQVSAPEKEHK